MPLRDWAFVMTAALLLVQAGCNRSGKPDGSGGSSAAVSSPTGSPAPQPFATGRAESLHHSLQLPA